MYIIFLLKLIFNKRMIFPLFIIFVGIYIYISETNIKGEFRVSVNREDELYLVEGKGEVTSNKYIVRRASVLLEIYDEDSNLLMTKDYNYRGYELAFDYEFNKPVTCQVLVSEENRKELL